MDLVEEPFSPMYIDPEESTEEIQMKGILKDSNELYENRLGLNSPVIEERKRGSLNVKWADEIGETLTSVIFVDANQFRFSSLPSLSPLSFSHSLIPLSVNIPLRVSSRKPTKRFDLMLSCLEILYIVVFLSMMALCIYLVVHFII